MLMELVQELTEERIGLRRRRRDAERSAPSVSYTIHGASLSLATASLSLSLATAPSPIDTSMERN